METTRNQNALRMWISTPTGALLFVKNSYNMLNNKNEADNQLSTMKEFTFNPTNQPVRVETIDNNPWFVAKDVCDAL